MQLCPTGIGAAQVRTTKTMDLGSYTWWGIIVFVVEMLGASTTLLYGLNLLWVPHNDPLALDPEIHGLTKVKSPRGTYSAGHRDTLRLYLPCNVRTVLPHGASSNRGVCSSCALPEQVESFLQNLRAVRRSPSCAAGMRALYMCVSSLCHRGKGGLCRWSSPTM